MRRRTKKIQDVFHNPRKKTLRLSPRSINIELSIKAWHPLYARYRFQLLAALSILLILGTFGIYRLTTRASVAVLYPTSCLGGWVNVHHAEGKPDIAAAGDYANFNENNSAFLPANTLSEMYCGTFTGNISEDSQPKEILLSFSWATQDEVTAAAAQMALSNTSSSTVIDTAAAMNSISGDISSTTTASTTTSNSIASSSETSTATTTTTSSPVIIVAPIDAPPLAPDVPLPTEPLSEPVSTPSSPPSSSDAAPAPTPAAVTAPVDTSAPASVPAPTPPPPASADTTQSSIFDFFVKKVFAEEISGSSSSVTNTNTTAATSTTTNSTSTTVTDTTSTTLSSPIPPAVPSGFLEVDYTLDGTNWMVLGLVDEAHLHSSTFEIPLTGVQGTGTSTATTTTNLTWRDMSNIQIKVKSVSTIDPIPALYLDGMSLQVTYGNEDLNFKSTSGLYIGHVQVASSTDSSVSLKVRNDGTEQELVLSSSHASIGGLAIYNASTSAQLMTTFVTDSQYVVSPEYFGVGSYDIIITNDPNNCANQGIDECRRSSDIQNEGTFEIVTANSGS